jgi:hypothetical protein
MSSFDLAVSMPSRHRDGGSSGPGGRRFEFHGLTRTGTRIGLRNARGTVPGARDTVQISQRSSAPVRMSR